MFYYDKLAVRERWRERGRRERERQSG